MNRLITSFTFLFLIIPEVFAGESGYVWFDINTCSYGKVSTDDYVEDGAVRCIDLLREEYSKGKLLSFYFEDNPACGVVAAAKYKPLKVAKNASPAFSCVAGCESWVPPLLQLISQESSGREITHPAISTAFKSFKRKCSAKKHQ